ncbi:MAG: helix-turn-helix transcriptional regulator [Alphaproteobacteria bacterium]|nr:helix-turn-helix transcriptional regulator [Alphaproteobacteria bacterium]
MEIPVVLTYNGTLIDNTDGNGSNLSANTPDPVDVHVGRRLRLRREILRLSQEQVANAIGVTFQQIQKYEQGRNRISSSRLFDISNVLGVPVTYLFQDLVATETTARERKAASVGGMAEAIIADFDAGEAIDRTETLELVRSFWRIPNPRARQELLGLVKLLVDK